MFIVVLWYIMFAINLYILFSGINAGMGRLPLLSGEAPLDGLGHGLEDSWELVFLCQCLPHPLNISGLGEVERQVLFVQTGQVMGQLHQPPIATDVVRTQTLLLKDNIDSIIYMKPEVKF